MVLPSLFYVNYSGQQPWLLTHIGQCLKPTVCQECFPAKLAPEIFGLNGSIIDRQPIFGSGALVWFVFMLSVLQ